MLNHPERPWEADWRRPPGDCWLRLGLLRVDWASCSRIGCKRYRTYTGENISDWAMPLQIRGLSIYLLYVKHQDLGTLSPSIFQWWSTWNLTQMWIRGEQRASAASGTASNLPALCQTLCSTQPERTGQRANQGDPAPIPIFCRFGKDKWKSQLQTKWCVKLLSEVSNL